MKKNILLVLLAMISFLYSAGITIGPNARVSFGNVNVNVYGNLKNTLAKDGGVEKLGQITVLPTSKVSFVGSSQDTVTNIYTFPNVVINKPSGNVLIANSTNNFLLTNNITFTKGSVLTGTSTFELGTTATVSGESTNGYIVGTAKAARSVGTGTNSFGGIGYSINNTGSDLGTVTVYRYTGDGNEVVLYGSEGIWRKWDVQTSNAFSGTRQVTTSWLSNEDNGNVLANLKVWKYETAKSADDEDADAGVRKVSIKERSASKSLDRDVEFVEEEGMIEEEPKTLGWVEVDGAVFNTAASPRTATYTISAATQYTINDVVNAFADGSGTESNPYQIATLDQLNAVRYYLSAHFIQIADIDASATSTWDSGAGWMGIYNFAGVYNGNGHTVSNLFVNRPAQNYQALFGRLNGATINDLGVTGCDITGATYVGNLIGLAYNATVNNCFAEGDVKGNTEVGAFAGRNSTGSVMNNCYANGTVTRSSGQTSIYIGGFAGLNYNQINDSYSTSSVIYEGTANPTDKGFLGSSSGTTANTFWNIDTSGQISSAGTATGLTKDQMRTLSIFTNAGWDFQDESANGVDDIWGINAVENSGYPFLSWEGITHNPSPFAGGIGTSDEPFLVSNLTQLDAVRDFASFYFLQTADIDASPTSTWDSGAGWTPVAAVSPYFTGNYDGDMYKITGLFINRAANYQSLFGYTSGADINNVIMLDADITGNQYVAGISSYAVSTTIDNCSVSGTVVANTSYAGGISGNTLTSSVVSNSFVNGTVRSLTYAGGVSARVATASQIVNCYAKGTVSRISGTSTVFGGICGYNNDAKILKCYSTAAIVYEGSTNPTTKGIVGAVTGSTTYEMADNFFDSQVSGQTSTSGIGTAKTTAEMQNVATYTDLATSGLTSPWDFVGDPNDDAGIEDIWNIHASINGGYPYLNWEYRIPVEAPANLALAVGASDVTITWDAVTGATGYLVYSSADPYGTFILDETGVFNGTEWTGPLTGTKMFYYVAAVNDTKVITAKTINLGGSTNR